MIDGDEIEYLSVKSTKADIIDFLHNTDDRRSYPECTGALLYPYVARK